MRPADRLQVLRRAYAQRADLRGLGEHAYAVYLALLLGPLVGYPVLRAAVLALSEPAVLAALGSSGAATGAGVVFGLLLAAALWFGGLYGPVTLEPALVPLWAGTDIPRSRSLARTFVGRGLVMAGLVTSAAALPTVVLVHTRAASVGAGVSFVLMSAGFGAIAAIAWLAGQAGERRFVWLVGAGTSGLAVLTGVVPSLLALTPWGWVGAAWPTADTPGVPARALLLAAAVAVACSTAPRLLDSLTVMRLGEDAEKWHATSVAVVSGDIAHAMGRLRARPSSGRTWRAVRDFERVMRFLVADAVGGMRTPVRFSVGLLTLACAGLLLAVAPAAQAGWVLAGIGAGLGYLSLGVFSDGFRHATEAAVAPALYGYSDATLFALHFTLPVVASAVALVAGLVAAQAVGGAGSGLAVALTFGLAVVVRAYDAAKGPLPAILLTSIPSPFGDLSSLNVVIWQADAPLIAATAGAAIAALVHSGAETTAVVATVMLGALLLAGLRHRLARL